MRNSKFWLNKTDQTNKKFLKTQYNGTNFYNTFIILLYFILTFKELTAQQF